VAGLLAIRIAASSMASPPCDRAMRGLRLVTGQPAMQGLPGVLAVAEHARSSGREMLALSSSVTTSQRVFALRSPAAAAHQNGQASLLGAALRGAPARP
jgi:hypothetical protein